MYRPSTLRRMPPFQRKVARLINEQERIARQLKKMLPDIGRLELDSRALFQSKKFQENEQPCSKDDLTLF